MAGQTNEAEEKQAPKDGLASSVQVLPLPGGIYLFSVRIASPRLVPSAGQITLPAVHVTMAPGADPAKVEFMSTSKSNSTWLFAVGDMLVARVSHPGANLLLTSLRAPEGEALDLRVERLEGRDERLAIPTAVVAPSASGTAAVATSADAPEPGQPLRLQIGAHVRARGDMAFDGAGAWAGRVAPGLWLEAFSVTPLEALSAEDIEYKGLTASGFETPWLGGGKACGTRGLGVPLVGFALRLRPGAATADYDCQYSGHFKSGGSAGPMRNGTPCRSTIANDPLEGIQIRILRKVAGTASSSAGATPDPAAAVSKSGGPQFSKFREQAQPPATEASPAQISDAAIETTPTAAASARKPGKTRAGAK